MSRLAFLAAATLALPLALLLFAQWPLRDLVQAYSREANDLAQIIFALYMAVAVTWASREGAHIAAGHADSHDAEEAPWRRWAVLACVAPWSLFVLWTSAPAVWQSVRQLEHFGESFNPGYFVIKLALWLMLVLVLWHAVARTLKPGPHSA